MTAAVFVDANVLIYARDPREPTKQTRAAGWVADLWRRGTGRTSMQVLTEYYVVATRKLTTRLDPEDAWDDVVSFLAWRPQPTDEAVIRRARETERRYKLSWWDSMIVAAAQLQDCPLLLTEDMQDGAVMGGVTIRNPFTLAIEEARPAYQVATSARRHPPRGRPRRKTLEAGAKR